MIRVGIGPPGCCSGEYRCQPSRIFAVSSTVNLSPGLSGLVGTLALSDQMIGSSGSCAPALSNGSMSISAASIMIFLGLNTALLALSVSLTGRRRDLQING